MKMIARCPIVFFLFNLLCWGQVTLHPGDNVPKIVSSKPPGTTFVFTPGTYRLAEPIKPKDNDEFIGQAECAPPSTPCPAVISGAVAIDAAAKFDGTNYKVINQTQQGPRGVPSNCDPGWSGCIYPEDLFFDDRPYQHLDAATLPDIGPGQWWFDYTNHIIYFHDDPSGHKVETSVLLNGFGGPANNVTIRYLTVEKFADMYPFGAIGGPQGPRALTQGTHWTVKNSEIRLNHGIGVRVGVGMQILDNYVDYNGEVGIGGGIGATSAPETQSTSSGIVVQGNTLNYNNFAHFNPGFGAGGFKVGAASGVILRHNTVEHNEGTGIHFDVNSMNELVDDNEISDNSDGDGISQEIGYGTSTFRNNLVLRNAVHVNGSSWGYQMAVRASSGVNAYCNVLEIPKGEESIGAWAIGAADRGKSYYPPYQYLTTTGNSFHHNTVIWDPGAGGGGGFFHNDPANQPDFFAANAPPDHNSYHFSANSPAVFVYDHDNSRRNQRKRFANYQASGAEVHGTADTNNTSGFPRITVTSPSDQSSVSGPVRVSANASDESGISKVEFYVDWSLESTIETAPYNFDWKSGVAGPHIVAAMAYSKAGIRACYAVTLNVQ